jgi:hypothetical protein
VTHKSGSNTKNSNQQLSVLPIIDLGQQRLNGAADGSATKVTKGGQVLPHSKHIVSGALMLPCPIMTVF